MILRNGLAAQRQAEGPASCAGTAGAGTATRCGQGGEPR